MSTSVGAASSAEFSTSAASVNATVTPATIASGNAHRTHFGENFDITLPDGSPAHSSCAGMGMERATIALLVRHGMDVAAWPADVKDRLGLA